MDWRQTEMRMSFIVYMRSELAGGDNIEVLYNWIAAKRAPGEEGHQRVRRQL